MPTDHKKPMLFPYHRTGEIALPDGVSVYDLNWMVFSWDLYRKGTSKRSRNGRFYQVVVIPGAVMVRFGTNRPGFGAFSRPVGEIRILPPEHVSPMEVAKRQTGIITSQHYDWVCKPFAMDTAKVDMPDNPGLTLKDRYYDSEEITTITDLLYQDDGVLTDDNIVVEEFFNTLFHYRKLVQDDKAVGVGKNTNIFEGR